MGGIKNSHDGFAGGGHLHDRRIDNRAERLERSNSRDPRNRSRDRLPRAGTILKLSSRLEVKGLTTASSIWLAAAPGTVAGLGEYALAAASGLVSLVVLAVLRPLAKALGRDPDEEGPEEET